MSRLHDCLPPSLRYPYPSWHGGGGERDGRGRQGSAAGLISRNGTGCLALPLSFSPEGQKPSFFRTLPSARDRKACVTKYARDFNPSRLHYLNPYPKKCRPGLLKGKKACCRPPSETPHLTQTLPNQFHYQMGCLRNAAAGPKRRSTSEPNRLYTFAGSSRSDTRRRAERDTFPPRKLGAFTASFLMGGGRDSSFFSRRYHSSCRWMNSQCFP